MTSAAAMALIAQTASGSQDATTKSRPPRADAATRPMSPVTDVSAYARRTCAYSTTCGQSARSEATSGGALAPAAAAQRLSAHELAPARARPANASKAIA